MDIIGFTLCHKDVKLKIYSCKAFGGKGDGPEDIAGALMEGLKFQF